MQDEEGLIAAALLVSNDAVYKKDDQWVNIFGSRDAGIVACQYDEFFHRVKQEDGTKSAPGITSTRILHSPSCTLA